MTLKGMLERYFPAILLTKENSDYWALLRSGGMSGYVV